MQRREITENEKKALTVGSFIVFGLAVVIGSIILGRSDKGVIDVSAAIQNANRERQEVASERGEEAKPIAVPNAQTAGKPNGGLVGTGKSESAPQPEPEPEETASSTASTTESVTESATDETKATENTDEEPESKMIPAEEQGTTPSESESTASPSDSVESL